MQRGNKLSELPDPVGRDLQDFMIYRMAPWRWKWCFYDEKGFLF